MGRQLLGIASPEDRLRWGEDLTAAEVEDLIERKVQSARDDADHVADMARDYAADAVFDAMHDLKDAAKSVEGDFGERLSAWLEENCT